MNEWKVIVFGSKQVGKTTLINSFLAGKTGSEYVSEDPNFLSRDVVFNNEKHILQVMDSPKCKDCIPSMNEEICSAHGFVIMYSITNRETFNEAQKFVNHLWKLNEEKPFPLVIAGNKRDLESQRDVLFEEGMFFAHKWESPCLELSALQEPDAAKLFQHVLTEINTHKCHRFTNDKERYSKFCCDII